MQRFFLDIEKLHVGDAAENADSAYVFLAQPTPLEEQALGRLFLIVSIGGASRNATEVMRIMRDEMRDRYYHTEELEMSSAFEEALNSMNRKLNGLVREGITDWLGEFSAIIGVIRSEKILFTNIGRMDMFIISGRRMVNILGAPEQAQEINPLKIFSSIVEGELTEGSSLLLTTSALLDYFSQEKLRQLIVNRPAHEAVSSLEQLLHDHQQETQFAVIAARLIPTHDEVPTYRVASTEQPQRAPTAVGDSMEELITREHKTNELLAPSLLAEMGRRTSKAANDFSLFWKTKVQRKPHRRIPVGSVLNPSHQRFHQERPHYFLQFVGLIERGIRALARGGSSGVQRFKKEKPLTERALELPKDTEGFLSKLIVRFQKLPRRRKIILVTALVALVVFAQSIVILGQRSQRAGDIEKVAQTFTTIDQNLLDAQTSLSFGDTGGAQRVLQESRQLLSDAPITTKKDRERSQTLQTQIEDLLDQTRNIRSIGSLIMKGDFSTLSADATGMTLAAVGGNLFSINPNTNTIYRVGTDTLGLTLIPPPDVLTGTIRFAGTDGTRLILVNDANAAFAYTPETDSWKALTLPVPSGDHAFAGMTLFQGRLYLLDTTQNQIFRFPGTANGFGSSATWIRDEVTDLSSAVDLDVDGSVYITSANGTVQRYFQGAHESFSLSAADPALSAATSLWTSEASTNLYILDSATHRILRYTKEGKFAEQYQFAEDTELRAFTIDEANKRGFVLTGTVVGEFPLSE